MRNVTAQKVREFLSSWGLHFDSPDGDSTDIPYPQVYIRMKHDALKVGGFKLAEFVSRITDTTDSRTYLTPESWDEVTEAWEDFQV